MVARWLAYAPDQSAEANAAASQLVTLPLPTLLIADSMRFMYVWFVAGILVRLFIST